MIIIEMSCNFPTTKVYWIWGYALVSTSKLDNDNEKTSHLTSTSGLDEFELWIYVWLELIERQMEAHTDTHSNQWSSLRQSTAWQDIVSSLVLLYYNQTTTGYLLQPWWCKLRPFGIQFHPYQHHTFQPSWLAWWWWSLVIELDDELYWMMIS